MRRTELPPLAAWILEHGIPGDYDEALAGDLLEEFRSGRSDGWFWRQVLAAWLVGWLKYLSMRRSLLVFAALWSAVAPRWAAIVDRIDSFDSILTWKIGHLFSMFCFWVALNLAFIFVGMLLFIIIHSRISSAFSGSKLGRAFMLAPLIFLPLYFATFVVMNLFAYPGFVIDEGARTPLGEIADFNLRADALRIPYFLTLLWAMWGATPLMKSFSITPIGLKFVKPPTEASIPAANASPAPSPASYADPYTTKRFLVLMVGAGLLNALIAGFLLCRLPDSHTPSLQSLLIRATIYVAIGALAGIAGIYLYWNSSASPFRTAAPIPFSLFALACAAGWIWVPSMVIFSEQLSAATVFVGAIGAFRSNYTACALLALSASIFAWQRTLARDYDLDARREYKRAALRLALVFVLAVLVTIWALLDGVAHRNYLAAVNAARSTADAVSTDEDADQQTKTPPSATGISGYQSVILWPVPEKKQILPPLPPQTSLLAPGTTKPLIIKFDGPYWYFQPPHKGPSPRAFQVRGTPLVHDFQTNNFVSLIMEAHQTLGASIPVARCREIQVGILNSDNRRGIINLAVLLTDSSSPSKPQLYLGLQPVASSLPANFTAKSSAAGETLRFPIPSPSKIRKFDEITVMFFPDPDNYDKGSKVAIDQFQLIPR